MNRSIYLLSTIISLVLYLNAPHEANFIFNLLCLLIFIFESYTVLKYDFRHEGLFNFNIIFLFSFFWVSYAFPVLIYGTKLDIREGIEAYIDFDVSSRCTALCTLAISIYFLSYSKFENLQLTFSKFVRSEQYVGIKIIYYVLFLGLFYQSYVYMRNVGGIAVEAGVWYSMFLACFPICLINNTYMYEDRNFGSFVRHNISILLPAFVLMLLYFIIGDRGLVIILGVSIAAIYSYRVATIRPAIILVAIIVGTMLMFVVRETRNSDNSLGRSSMTEFASGAKDVVSDINPVVLFSDLTGIHRELYIGYEYHESNGLIEPWQAVIVPFYPIPLVPNIISKRLFNKTMDEIKPGMILNEYMAYTGHGHFGIHCVIDIFMRWGLIGVLIVFYLWGMIVRGISNSKYNNVLCMALYVILVASAIRIPRAPMLDMLRTFAYVVFFVWMTSRLSIRR